MPDSLVDLGKLSEPVTKLIESVSSAIAVGYEPIRIRRAARAEADAALIKAEGDAKVQAFNRRIQARLEATEARRQRNIEAIVEGAVLALPEAVTRDPIDPDWVAEFFNQSQDVSNEAMQSIWSRLLAGETAVPGSYSRRTLNALRGFNQLDAELFTLACRYAVLYGGEPILIAMAPFYAQKGLHAPALYHLQALGLIQTGLSYQVDEGDPLAIRYGEKNYGIRLLPAQKTLLGTHTSAQLDVVSFTQVGLELFGLTTVESDLEFPSAITAYLEELTAAQAFMSRGMELFAL